MSMYGYARVSSLSQSTDIQVARLKAAGCELVLDEAVSGRSRAGRSELETILSFIRPGGYPSRGQAGPPRPQHSGRFEPCA